MQPSEAARQPTSLPDRDEDLAEDLSTPEALRTHVTEYAKARVGEYASTAKPLQHRKAAHDLSGITEVHMPDPAGIRHPNPLNMMAHGIKVYVWAPDEQHPTDGVQIGCPRCGSTSNITLGGWNPTLRSVKSVDHENFILYRRYVHNNCRE